jgi:integrase
MSVLTAEEASSFLEAAKKDRLAALFDLALASGMRPGEYLGLRWKDVDLDSKLVRVTPCFSVARCSLFATQYLSLLCYHSPMYGVRITELESQSYRYAATVMQIRQRNKLRLLYLY